MVGSWADFHTPSVSPVHTIEVTGVEPMSLVDTILLVGLTGFHAPLVYPVHTVEVTGVEPISLVEIDPLGKTVPWVSISIGANDADGLLDPNDDVLDQVPADRLDRIPWPGVSVSAVYPYPTKNISMASKSARSH